MSLHRRISRASRSLLAAPGLAHSSLSAPAKGQALTLDAAEAERRRSRAIGADFVSACSGLYRDVRLGGRFPDPPPLERALECRGNLGMILEGLVADARELMRTTLPHAQPKDFDARAAIAEENGRAACASGFDAPRAPREGMNKVRIAECLIQRRSGHLTQLIRDRKARLK